MLILWYYMAHFQWSQIIKKIGFSAMQPTKNVLKISKLEEKKYLNKLVL